MKYYEINEASARQAKEANSFYEYRPGSATKEYRSEVDKAYALAEEQKARVDPIHHEKIDNLVDKYARKLADNLNESYRIESRVPSVLIAGGSNFPTGKKLKQNAARDRNMGQYMEIKKILDKIRGTGMGGISADDERAVEKLEAKLADMQEDQKCMKEVNAYYRKHKSLDGCPFLTSEVIEQLKVSMAHDWHTSPVPYPAWQLSNNNQNIHRVKQRIEDLKNRSEYAGWSFAGGEAKINEAENRLQLLFEDKPSDDQRKALKSNGFRWAPSQGAWQRQLTKNAIYAAGRIDFIKPENGGTPWQLQPFSHNTGKNQPER